MKPMTPSQVDWSRIGQGTPDSLTEPLAILLIGSWITITWASFAFNSVAAVLGWMFTSTIIVMAILGIVPIEAYWMTLVINAIAVAATVGYDAI